MMFHKPRFSTMDPVILIAILAVIFAFVQRPESIVALSCVSVYSSILAAFFGPLTKMERAIYIGIPAIAVILLLPALFASRAAH